MEWTNQELKKRARGSMKHYYDQAFAVTLLCTLLEGRGFAGVIEITLATPMILLAILVIGSLIFAALVLNVIQVGIKRFYMESRAWEAGKGVGRIFYGFRSGHYINLVRIMF